MEDISSFLIQCRANVPLSCYFIHNHLEIQTNNRNLYQDLKSFFDPFFSIKHYLDFSDIRPTKIKIITIDELQILQLFPKIKDGTSTFQYVGGPNKYWEWKTIEQNGYIISKSNFLRTIVIQTVSDNNLIIITPNINAARVSQKIIKSEILYKDLQKRGSILFNSAAVSSKDGKGVLIVGQKNSGKTSTMLSLVSGFGMSIISDGLTFIKENNLDGFSIHGTPERSRVGSDITQKYKEFSPYCHSRKQIIHTNLFNPYGNAKKVELSLNELSRIFDCEIQKEEKLDLIIFPEISDTKKTCSYELSSNEIKNKLQKNLIYPLKSKNTPWKDIIHLNIGRIEGQANKLIDKLANNTNGIVINLTKDMNNFEKTLEKYLH
ncbi:hypothetical protein EXW32_29940 (plasmid) [Bacillus mycoides]|uniref:hypothetical protein n=1 Tax=Bacillus mycoides TaxID=1405 RepID=UPI001C01CBDA|nr:hypothetical protein [Bacillus mycoides]QWG70545.1 hypothetical protein EXW32_29940 [Bacillus mycoides]